MTRGNDPLAIARDELDDLEKRADAVRRHLVGLIYDELRRGVPKTVVARRTGVHAETVRRWLRTYGYDDAVGEPRGRNRGHRR